MKTRDIYHDYDSHKESIINSMQKYVENKQELDKFLEKQILPFIENKQLKLLDAGCGLGHISYLLSKINPNLQILGIDKEDYLIEQAQKLCQDKKNISFHQGDICNLQSKFKKEFDVCVNWKVISWLPYYEECLRSLVSVTKSHIFLSSLFYDGDIDFEIRVKQYKRKINNSTFSQYYNIYSFPRFQEFVYGLGAKNVEAFNFDIEIDLPKPSPDKMGTYTIRLDDGKRLQISGAIVMFWKVIKIDL